MLFLQGVLNSIVAGRAVGVEWESKMGLLIMEVWYEYQNKYRYIRRNLLRQTVVHSVNGQFEQLQYGAKGIVYVF
jgi:hypothetical protein